MSQQDAMQRRYNELGAKEERQPLTKEEMTESVFLYYKVYPDGIEMCTRHGTTPEQVYGLVWCAQCERAHVPQEHTP